MTRPYITLDGLREDMFPSVTFLVFANRLLAFVAALVLVRQDSAAPPFFGVGGIAQSDGLTADTHSYQKWKRVASMFAPSSLSNVLSSVCQYTALLYVSFPTQVLFKSNKIIPTMAMGKVLLSKTYSLREYLEALAISMAVAIFILNEKGKKASDAGDDENKESASLGIICLCLYLICDSFTSQWQSRVFRIWKLSQYQMMLGVNAFSLVYTLVKTLASGEVFRSLGFLLHFPQAAFHIVLFSVASTVGQLFIFYTIKRFGAVVFSMIMTTRQVLSMVLSCVIFGHALSGISILAAGVVFYILGLRIHRRMKK